MKEIRKVVNLTKQFFVFSKPERKGIYALILIIVVVAWFPQIYRVVFPPETLDLKVTDLRVLETESKNNTNAIAINDLDDTVEHKLFYFNPNTIDSSGLIALGFTPKLAKGILKYRSKGGYFKSAESLYKIYGADSNLITQLIPYVQLANKPEDADRASKLKFEDKPKAKNVSVDINTADSIQLVALYGIGPKMAAKIIDYRQRTGGFFNTSQLLEIYGMDEDVLMELAGKIHADVQNVRYLRINSVLLEELKRNPYVKSKLANAIVNYRKQHGAFKKIEDLKNIVILQDSTYNKLLPYLTLD